MSNPHGRKYEHDLAAELKEVTPPEVWTTTCGYSGNSAIDSSDLVVTVDPQLATRAETVQYNIEAKKRRGDGGKRVSGVFSGGGEESGLEELLRLVEGTPSWADPIVAIKFDRRKLLVLDARWLLSYLGHSKWYIPEVVQKQFDEIFKPRLTGADAVSMIKPSLDLWDSASAAQMDGVVLAEKLGLPVIDDD